MKESVGYLFRTQRWHWVSVRVHVQITTTKLVTLGLGNPSAAIPHYRERTRPGFLAQLILDRSYWGSCWWTNQKMDDVIINQWNCRIGRILGMIPKYAVCLCELRRFLNVTVLDDRTTWLQTASLLTCTQDLCYRVIGKQKMETKHSDPLSDNSDQLSHSSCPLTDNSDNLSYN